MISPSTTLKAIELKGYRGFTSHGVRLPMSHEFLAVLGVNNSGKSALIRSLYEFRPLLQGVAETQNNNAQMAPFHGVAPLPSGLQLRSGEQYVPVWGSTSSPRIILERDPDPSIPADIEPVRFTIELHDIQTGHYVIETADGATARFTSKPRFVLHQDGEFRESVLDVSGRRVRWQPIKQMLLAAADTMYIGGFRNALNEGGSREFDLDVGSKFVQSFAQRKSGDNPQSAQSVQAMLRELEVIFGVERLDVHFTPEQTRLNFTVDGQNFKGSEMGAGITQFVMVAASVMERRPRYLLIDEPETNLHASLQLQFLTLLARYVSSGVIFTTHSLGLARTADRTLVTSRSSKGVISLADYHASSNLSSTLGEMSYGGRSEVGYQAALLVEGVTDVRVFLELLAQYGVRGKVVVLPLGGDDLTAGGRAVELQEIKRVADKVYAFVDSERRSAADSAEKRRERFLEECTSAGIEAYLSERRATENYFPQGAIDAEYGANAITPFDHYEKPPKVWRKERNWRVAAQTGSSDLAGTDLDRVLGEIAKFCSSQDAKQRASEKEE